MTRMNRAMVQVATTATSLWNETLRSAWIS